MSMLTLAILAIGNVITLGVVHGTQFSRAASSTMSVTDVNIPSGADPWGTTFDRGGRVWVAIPGCDPTPACNSNTPPGKIAVYNPRFSRWVGSYQLPSTFAQPLFLAFDHKGKLWFPMPMSNSLGMFDPGTGIFQQWAVPTPAAGPWDVAIDAKGVIWFTEHYSNKIGAFDPITQRFTEIATPATNSLPYGITVDAANNIWFAENNSAVALIGEYTAQKQLLEYKIRNTAASGLTPHLITTDHNGNVWWSEGWVGMVGKLQVASAKPGTNSGVTEYPYQYICSNCGTHTSGIHADSSGNVWFDDSLQSTFGMFPVNSNSAALVYNTPTPNSHPHDGLNVDAQNTIWFDEEFANKIAHAVPGSGGSTPTPTPTATATVTPGPGKTLAQDTFRRQDQQGWGKASDGHTWKGDVNTASAFSIAANTGQVANGSTSYNAILGPTATNAEVLVTGSISSFSNTNFGAVLRWTDTNNWYKAYIDGTSLVLQKRVNGTATVLALIPFAASAGTSYTIHFRVAGTSLMVNAWPSSTTEPSNWMITQPDSSFGSGFCGLRMLVQGGAVLNITSFQALVP